MSKKNGLLSLPNVASDFGLEASAYRDTYKDSFSSEADKRRFLDDSSRQRATIESIRGKAFHGMRKMAEVDRYAMTIFTDTVDFIADVQDKERGDDFQSYIEEFGHHMIQVTAHHVLGTVKISAFAIAEEIAKPSFVLAPDEEQNKGFLARLIGG
jgi:hypothetical protein